ncbi:L-ascorbate metabolism protein UlaG (beta-lactamase superfamily) [Dyadobacter jejuensis]|uniref:L-ascorbate metabolism protein UlaG (Beta-lactamase superfamily) n=1 Tax=Dyadobacter jejuensis TaxID=1082580 RepID=A0A316A997_9BACT|nr:MBL fold metallo-hydrolase [Dyadobacter jejuensis]PWJ54496.1 L-ascorbate metabolism protein UlaG (beta-lactamase superfamily) [Dyadobacter jejuensis]
MITISILIALVGGTVYWGLHLESLGKDPQGARQRRIEQSPHFRNGSFHNLTNTPVQSDDANYFTLLNKFLFDKNPKVAPPAPIPYVKTDLQLPPSAKPTITYFGHSSYLLQIVGHNILVDPVFSARTSPVQFLGTKGFEGTLAYGLEDLPAIQYVLLTHDHYDHLDYPTIRQLASKDIHFITALGVGAHLEYWGVPAQHITELDWWEETTEIAGFKLTATPARHFSGRGLKRGKTLWASYVLESAENRLYLGGDSGYERHFKEIGERFGPFDLVILECGQYNRWWPYIHMMPEQTAQAALDLKAKVLWPVHWGKFALAMHDWDEPAKRIYLKSQALNIPLAMPKIGQQIVLGEAMPHEAWWENI